MEREKKIKGKIVYIDDEVEACKTIVEFFTLRSYGVNVAFDAEVGHDLIREMNPNIIIIDLKIAGVSGIDLLERLRNEKIDIPVIVVTAFHEAMTELQERELMVDKVFTKPYSLEDLHNVVRELLEVTR